VRLFRVGVPVDCFDWPVLYSAAELAIRGTQGGQWARTIEARKVFASLQKAPRAWL